MNRYYFLSEMNRKYNVLQFLPEKENPTETFLDFYDKATEFFQEQHFLIDYLPMRMDNRFIFSQFFNTHHCDDNTRNNFRVYSFDDYYRKYLKIIYMLVGYSGSAFFESSILYNFSQVEYLNNDIISSGYNSGLKIFEISPENLSLFVNLLQDSLRDRYKLVIYLPNLDIIIEVSNLLLNRLVLGEPSLLIRTTQTEGLYFYKYNQML